MQQQTPQNMQQNAVSPTLSVKDWLITLIVLAIPVVGFVMAIIWAIQADNPSKRNFFIAYWILVAIMIVLMILFMVIFGAAMFTVGASGGYQY